MQAAVRQHSRRGYEVRAHSREVNGAIGSVLQRDAERIIAARSLCQHGGGLTAHSRVNGAAYVRWFKCQDCGAAVEWDRVAEWARTGRVSRDEITIG